MVRLCKVGEEDSEQLGERGGRGMWTHGPCVPTLLGGGRTMVSPYKVRGVTVIW